MGIFLQRNGGKRKILQPHIFQTDFQKVWTQIASGQNYCKKQQKIQKHKNIKYQMQENKSLSLSEINDGEMMKTVSSEKQGTKSSGFQIGERMQQKVEGKDKISQRNKKEKEKAIKVKMMTGADIFSHTHIRLAKSGDITMKLNKQNTKLRNNVQQLHALFRKGSPSGKLTKMSNLYGNKMQKYRQKAKQTEEIFIGLSKEVKQFQEWWNYKFKESLLSEKKRTLQECSLESKPNIDWLVEEKLRDAFAKVKGKIDQLQLFQRKMKLDYQIEEETQKKQLKSFLQNISYENKIDFSPLAQISGLDKTFLEKQFTEISSIRYENKHLHSAVLRLTAQNEALISKLRENVIQVEDGSSQIDDQVRNLQNQKDILLDELKDLKKQKELQSQFLKEELTKYKNKIERICSLKDINQQLQSLQSLEDEKLRETPCFKNINLNYQEISEHLKGKVQEMQKDLAVTLQQNRNKSFQLQKCMNLLNDCEELIKNNQQLLKKKDNEIQQVKKQKSKITEALQNDVEFWKEKNSPQEQTAIQQANQQYHQIKKVIGGSGSIIQNLKKYVNQKTQKKIRDFLFPLLEKINLIDIQVKSIQEDINKNNNILGTLIRKSSQNLRNLEKKLEENESSLKEQIKKPNKGINIQIISKYLAMLERNIHKIQRNRASGENNIDIQVSEEKKQLEILMMEQIKQLQQTNDNLLENLKEALKKINGHEQFVEKISSLYDFVIPPNKTSFLQQAIEYLSQIPEWELKQLKEVISVSKSIEQKEREHFLEAKDCFLHLYFDQSVDVQQIKNILVEKLSLWELEEMFDEGSPHEQIVNKIKQKIAEIEDDSSLGDRTVLWIEKARKKYFPVSSQLSEVLQQHLIGLCKAESDEQYLQAIESVFEQLQHHEQKCNLKLKRKDEVFKHHAGKITKICERQQKKEKEEIRKSMVVSHSLLAQPSSALIFTKDQQIDEKQYSL